MHCVASLLKSLFAELQKSFLGSISTQNGYTSHWLDFSMNHSKV